MSILRDGGTSPLASPDLMGGPLEPYVWSSIWEMSNRPPRGPRKLARNRSPQPSTKIELRYFRSANVSTFPASMGQRGTVAIMMENVNWEACAAGISAVLHISAK